MKYEKKPILLMQLNRGRNKNFFFIIKCAGCPIFFTPDWFIKGIAADHARIIAQPVFLKVYFLFWREANPTDYFVCPSIYVIISYVPCEFVGPYDITVSSLSAFIASKLRFPLIVCYLLPAQYHNWGGNVVTSSLRPPTNYPCNPRVFLRSGIIIISPKWLTM